MATMLHKSRADEMRRLEEAAATMARTRKFAGKGRGLLSAVLDAAGVGDWPDSPPFVRNVAFACRLCRSRESLQAFRRLMRRVEGQAGRLLHRACPDGQHTYVLPLQYLAEQHRRWQQAPEDWRPRTGNAPVQFAHLAGWLLGAEQGTAFRESVFFLPPGARVQLWFDHLGRGENNRPEAPRPVYLTKRMGFCFLQAPPRLDFIRALRWAQVHGFGGNPGLVRAVDYTRLGWQLWEPVDEEWWATVLQWLAGQPALDVDQVAPIVDYVCTRR
jgi:hypothetical protein